MLQALRADGMTMVLVEQNVTFGLTSSTAPPSSKRGQVVCEGDVSKLDTAQGGQAMRVGRLLGAHLEPSSRQGTPKRRTTTAAKAR